MQCIFNLGTIHCSNLAMQRRYLSRYQGGTGTDEVDGHRPVPTNFSYFNILSPITTALFHLVDVGFDVHKTYTYGKDVYAKDSSPTGGHNNATKNETNATNNGTLTSDSYYSVEFAFFASIAILVYSNMILMIFSLQWHFELRVVMYKDKKCRWYVECIAIILQMWLPLRCIKAIIHGLKLKSLNHKIAHSAESDRVELLNEQKILAQYCMDEENDCRFLMFLEGILETVPQLLLSIYAFDIHVSSNKRDRIFNLIFKLKGLLVTSWGLATYQKTLRFCRADKRDFTSLATLFYFLWQLLTIYSRIVVLSIFVHICSGKVKYGLFLYTVWGAHWLVMTLWIYLQNTNFTVNKFAEILYDISLGIVYMITFMNVKEGRTRLKCFIFYSVIVSEGIATVVLFSQYLKYDEGTNNGFLFESPMNECYFAMASFVGGIIAMLIYYQVVHPSRPYQSQMSIHPDYHYEICERRPYR